VGIFSAATLVGNAVGAVVFGYVAYRVGYAPMWTALAALMGGGIVLSMRLAGGPGPVRAPDTPPRALPPHAPTHRSVDLFPSPADTAEALRSTASAEDAHEHGVAKRKAGTPTRS
jgi:hypothetical protein